MLALIVVGAIAPVLNLWVPDGSPFHMSTYAVALLGKIMCCAIAALTMDLIGATPASCRWATVCFLRWAAM